MRAWLDVRDEPDAELRWWSAREREGDPAGDAPGEPAAGPLRRLAKALRLDDADLDLIQLAFAIEVDPMLALACGALQGVSGHGAATEALASRLFADRGPRPPAGRIARLWRVLEPDAATVPGGLRLDPAIARLLQERTAGDERLAGVLVAAPALAPLQNWPVESLAAELRDALRSGTGVRVIVQGPPGSGRATFAAAVVRALRLEPLVFDARTIDDGAWDEVHLRGQRLAHVGGAVPVWRDIPPGRRWPATVAPFPLQFVTAREGDACEPHSALAESRIVLSAPTPTLRRALWRAHVPAAGGWSDGDVARLAARHPLPIGDLIAVARRAPDTMERASALCRERTRDRLGELARPIATSFHWDDLIVDASLREALEQFTFEAADREAYFESDAARRLFPRGRGLVGLLSGPPGVGKTMAAEVIANVLDLDLVRVDLASVCSRYIGDTARSLREIFRAPIHGVLLFDEADAIFARRTEVRDSLDKHSNTDTGYILQLLDESDRWAAVLLSTNRKENLDPAFIRRIRYVFDFGRPDAALRARVWRQLLEALAPADRREALLAHCDALGSRFEATQAQIKNAILAAVFIARRHREPLALHHLSLGMAREWAKSGRSEAPTMLRRAVPRG
jgi:hypothetical protein